MIGGIDVAVSKVEKWQVTFNLTPSDAILEVRNLQNEVIQPKETNIYELKTGIYTYTASAEGYISKENVRLEVYQEITVDVKLQSNVEIVSFAEATDGQLEKMLNAHYNGAINIEEYWSVGDTRLVHINAIPSTSNVTDSHVEQNMTMVIIGFNHDNLKEQLGEKTKAAVTIQCKEVLGNNGTAENGYYWGSNYAAGEYDNYTNNPRRTWFNNDFVNALPKTFNPLIKTVVKKNLSDHSYSPSSITTEDKAFFISYPEVFGDESNTQYKGSTTLEGNQYEYYKTVSNRIKYANNNGVAKLDASCVWLLRSPSTIDFSNIGYVWFMVGNNDGSAIGGISYTNWSIAPAFCL